MILVLNKLLSPLNRQNVTPLKKISGTMTDLNQFSSQALIYYGDYQLADTPAFVESSRR